jgi:antitoxin component YwqK of YwqJK toxin-antitoxin module
MKKKYLWAGALLVLQGCSLAPEWHEYSTQVVDESYVHKYGFEVPVDEWCDREKHGQRICTLKTGVTCTESYSFGELDGESTFTYPYSTVINKVDRYSKGQLVERETRSQTGNPVSKTEFIGLNSKRITHWYDTGTPRAIEEFNGETLVKGDYYSPAGQIESQVADQNGTRTARNGQGILTVIDNIQNGQITLRTTFHPNNNPKEIIPYVNGQIDGHRRTFGQDGEPLTDEEWSRGSQTGLTITYRNGHKIAETPYNRGIKQGVEKRYMQDTLFQEVTYMDGHERSTRSFSR